MAGTNAEKERKEEQTSDHVKPALLQPATWTPVADKAAQEATSRRNDFVMGLQPADQQKISALENLDVELATLQARFRRDRRALERRFEAMYAPIFNRRASIIAALSSPDQGTSRRAPVRNHFGDDAPSHAPSFWLRAMKGMTPIATNVTAKDEIALQSLRDISCAILPEAEGVGFRLEFTFSPNNYFTNTKLMKTYYLVDRDTEPVLERVVGSEISWKPGMCLTTRACKHHGSRANEAAKNIVAQRSFFHFFATQPMRVEDYEGIEADFEVGVAFKEKIIPHAVRWFTGEAIDDDDYDEDLTDDEEFDDDIDDGEPSDVVGRADGVGANSGDLCTSHTLPDDRSALRLAPPKRTEDSSIGDGHAGSQTARVAYRAKAKPQPTGSKSR